MSIGRQNCGPNFGSVSTNSSRKPARTAITATSAKTDRVMPMTEIQVISTVPDDFKGDSYCADIHVHPSGRFVYAPDKGCDRIHAFRLVPEAADALFHGCEGIWSEGP